ncbi:MAG: type II secretion system secretin GspD [Nitrospinota bacterium]|nr:type II secretion system secretin GspD [Nitrospinota bacterium]
MKRLLSVLVFVVMFSGESRAATEDKVSMDFVNVDIAVVVKYISELTGRNFIIDEKVSGKVTIISPKMVTKKEAYRVFESILEVYGFLAIEVGSVTKIIPIMEGRTSVTEVTIGSKSTDDFRDHLVTQLIPLNYVSAEKLLSVIRPLVSPSSYISAYTPTNTLILVDTASSRERLIKIVEQLDVEGFESSIVVHKLRYASAKDLDAKINKILLADKSKNKTTEVQLDVISDDRLNALIVIGNEIFHSQVNNIIKHLDVPAPIGRQEINVAYLKNAHAEDLAKVLTHIAKADEATKKKKGAPATSDVPVNITADPATNSLVITASPEEFDVFKNVIEKLDIRRRQVFVEALIFEIRSDDTNKFGVEWRSTSKIAEGQVTGIGGTNFPPGGINDIAANPLAAGAGLVLGVVDGTMTFNTPAGTQTFTNIGGLIQALKSESGVNILSTPNLLTTDNVEAEIFVGENVPFKKSSAQTTAGLPTVTVERKDVGILLKIKPQINEADYVKLDIVQEISSISPVQLEKAEDIITFKRNAQTTVTVKDGQNIVIGGLIRNDMTETSNAVPYLGAIPLLGWLFKSKSVQKIETNLLIFITPHIINSNEDLEVITNEKNNLMQKLDDPTGKKAKKRAKEKAKEDKESKKEAEQKAKEQAEAEERARKEAERNAKKHAMENPESKPLPEDGSGITKFSEPANPDEMDIKNPEGETKP